MLSSHRQFGSAPAAFAQHRGDKARPRLGKLQERCRVQSLSVLVPMGQEMSYRYQEMLMVELVHALRLYRGKLEQ